MKTYTVYRLENVVTKKNYIGMTSQNPKKRWDSDWAKENQLEAIFGGMLPKSLIVI